MNTRQASSAGTGIDEASEHIRRAIRALDLALETAEEGLERASLGRARLLLIGTLAAQEMLQQLVPAGA